MRINFVEGSIGYRGTTRAIRSYFKAIKKLFPSVEAEYTFLKNHPLNKFNCGLELIEEGMKINAVSSFCEIETSHFDLLYHVTAEDMSEIHWFDRKGCNTLIHQVGYQRPPKRKHSYHFAYTSYWQAISLGDGNNKVLPYIIDEPLYRIPVVEARAKLGIQSDRIVLGRHGGLDTWNLPFVEKALLTAANTNKKLHFIFMNTKRFCDHPSFTFLDGTRDDYKRELFLQSCDAMIHARWEGETFGLACAEFLIRKKPIITWNNSRERNHILLADASLIGYNDGHDLTTTLANITIDKIHERAGVIPVEHLNRLYSEHAVMSRLREYL
ncbi:MAG: hypothetical protein FJ077_15425 [Cyanobacteria bacterium K_DeepCast_35m_m2_023]|nr:hypothetical protein [Cyanobacteria bacterium K_DeepCast_35m_m2_023]